MLRTVRELVAIGPRLTAEWDPAVRPPDAAPLPRMTTARVTSIEVYAQRIPLRAAAMLRRIASVPCVTRLVDEWCEAYERAYRPRWVPVEPTRSSSRHAASWPSTRSCARERTARSAGPHPYGAVGSPRSYGPTIGRAAASPCSTLSSSWTGSSRSFVIGV